MGVIFCMIGGTAAAVLCSISISDVFMPYAAALVWAGIYLLIYAVQLCISGKYNNLHFAFDILICAAFALFVTYAGNICGIQTAPVSAGIFLLMSFVKIIYIKKSLIQKYRNKSKNKQN